MSPQDRLQQALADYERLDVLAPLRAQSPLVPGAGPLDSPLMLIGEAPGEQEVKQGKPFVGPAGHFLDKLLIEAGIFPQLCYVTNTVWYRPPGNRTPYPFEISASRRRLFAEIAVVAPQMVVTLGATALQALRGSKGPRISECHGQLDVLGLVYPEEELWQYAARVFDGRNSEHIFKMLPTFHPAAALRDRIVHEKMREDLAVLTRILKAGRDAGS